tara:strand:- start:749 stop:2086 length:1338 start_codon:yes stop_codon:yes gene_type:complete
MARKDLSHRDASAHAASQLEYLIRSGKDLSENAVSKISPEEAMGHAPVFEAESKREVTRVLFISRNTELLNPAQQSLDGYVDLSDLFDEVHIVILRQGIVPKNPVLRVAPNVWLYTAAAKYWWKTPKAALEMIDQQLVFANGFRPDLVVARDPFESAYVARKVGEKYGRTTQLHILEDYTTRDFVTRERHNFWRRFIPRFTVPHFVSVRTLTGNIQNFLQRKFTIPDVDTLPRYQNYESLIDLQTDLDLKEKYKPAIFTLLFVGKLGHECTLFRALDAARFVLKNPRVAMVVIGDGVARGEFQKRTKVLEIEKQVIFETKVSDSVPYLKSANLLVVTDTDTDSEELVLKGAASGIPMVMARTEKREDLFDHGESAFLCDPADVQAFTDKINDLLNDVALREQFIRKGQEMIREKFHNDPAQYKEAYRTSIEQAFFVESDEDKSSQ